MATRAWPLAALGLLVATTGSAQLIPIRTIPIVQAHQFDLLPSSTRAMGGLSLAVDDSLLDPFTNPAMGARLRGSRAFSAPGLYQVSGKTGAGRSLPLGAMIRSGRWFATASAAAQQVDLSEQSRLILDVPFVCSCGPAGGELADQGRSNGNLFLSAGLGREIGQGLAIGGSARWAELRGVDAVDLLYAGSARVRQSGHTLDLRVGLLKEWSAEQSVSALLVHHRYAAHHDVGFLDAIWDPGVGQFGQRTRIEANQDQTNTWGLEVRYVHPLGVDGWRLGWSATANAASHPKIPSYDIRSVQVIPRDPGNSEAFNLGVGVAKRSGTATFGADLVYEPIWSYTWADTPEAIPGAGGSTIRAGGKTIENHFRFHNAIFRLGVSDAIALGESPEAVGLQLGLALHRIDYSLEQQDHLTGGFRRLDEGWLEWTPTWGLSARFASWELRYRGSLVNGTGRPGVVQDPGPLPAVDAGAPILTAPSGPLRLARVRIMTHQIAVSFPLR
ncbi:MAG: hypothetical protein AB7R55_09845 [Gemmatimonadales bacterium]